MPQYYAIKITKYTGKNSLNPKTSKYSLIYLEVNLNKDDLDFKTISPSLLISKRNPKELGVAYGNLLITRSENLHSHPLSFGSPFDIIALSDGEDRRPMAIYQARGLSPMARRSFIEGLLEVRKNHSRS